MCIINYISDFILDKTYLQGCCDFNDNEILTTKSYFFHSIQCLTVATATDQ